MLARTPSDVSIISISMKLMISKIFRRFPSNVTYYIRHFAERNDLLNISQIVSNAIKEQRLKPDPNRQDFIIGKISNCLKRMNLTKDNCKIVDIGGGNGNVLSGLREIISQTNKTNKEDFICVENANEWTETYNFDNSSITYKFWDNANLDIEDTSIDIVFCMVSLHHMTNETLLVLMAHINRILKPGGYVFIKEHDCDTLNVYNFTLWEHHLYHILDCGYSGKEINMTEYKNKSIYNFKSKKEWQELLEHHNFSLVGRFNRFLDGEYKWGEKANVTKMYWDIYTK